MLIRETNKKKIDIWHKMTFFDVFYLNQIQIKFILEDHLFTFQHDIKYIFIHAFYRVTT